MKHILFGLVACSLSLTVGAQQFQCGTDLMRARRIAEDPTYLQREAEYEEEVQRLMANSSSEGERGVVITIPIVFHIVHLGGDENITNDQILNQMDLLNEDFRALNTDLNAVHPGFVSRIGDAEIQFALPTLDPDGNCTNGIDRIQSPQTNVGDDGAKFNPWPRDKYLNIWVVNRMRDGVAGYAYYPNAWEGPIGRIRDGIIILNDYIGQIGTGTEYRSTALSHEIGHSFNLAHVWGNNNGVEEGPAAPENHMVPDCGDDSVEDTPVTRGWNECLGDPNFSSQWNNWRDCEFQAYENVVFGFNDVTTGSGAQDPGPVPNALDTVTGVLRCQLTAFSAQGVSANSEIAGQFAFSNWEGGALDGETDYANLTGSINTGKYYSFTIDPRVEDVSSITSVVFKMGRNATGARTFSVRSSVDGFGSNLPLSAAGSSLITIQTNNIAFYNTDAELEIPAVTVVPGSQNMTNFSGPLTFRIYGWNSEDASGTFQVDEVAVNGNFGAVENVQNYMEYSFCSSMFTVGQVARMRAAADSPIGERNNLWSQSNLEVTGVAEGFRSLCAPIADFYARTALLSASQTIPYTPTVCTGTNMQFVDNSEGGLPTGWSWTFADGTPSTSTQRDPVVSFSSPGWKSVTLTVSNENGSDTKSNDYSVLIGGSPEWIVGLYQESFENGTNLFPWTVWNYGNNETSFERSTLTSYAGNACALLNSGFRNPLDFVNSDNAQDIDALVSPTFDLDDFVNATFSFRYAYATTTNVLDNVTEIVVVETSTDCGRTWSQLGSALDGEELINNGNNSDLPTEWSLRSLNIPVSRLVPNVRFRITYTSSLFSGNLYIDDINVSGSVGIDDLSPSFFMSLYPNPTNDRFSLGVYGMDRFNTDIMITDIRGALIYTTTHRPSGTAGMEFSGRDLGLSEGLYMIRATNEAGNSTQKLIIGK